MSFLHTELVLPSVFSVIKASAGRGKQGETLETRLLFLLYSSQNCISLNYFFFFFLKERTELSEETEGCLQERWRGVIFLVLLS